MHPKNAGSIPAIGKIFFNILFNFLVLTFTYDLQLHFMAIKVQYKIVDKVWTFKKQFQAHWNSTHTVKKLKNQIFWEFCISFAKRCVYTKFEIKIRIIRSYDPPSHYFRLLCIHLLLDHSLISKNVTLKYYYNCSWLMI